MIHLNPTLTQKLGTARSYRIQQLYVMARRKIGWGEITYNFSHLWMGGPIVGLAQRRVDLQLLPQRISLLLCLPLLLRSICTITGPFGLGHLLRCESTAASALETAE
jgi:hypothetical protein